MDWHGERECEPLGPVVAEVGGDGADEELAGVGKDPKATAPVQQDGVEGEDDEGLGAALPEDVDETGSDADAKGHDGGGLVGAPLGGDGAVDGVRVAQSLGGVAAGPQRGRAQVGLLPVEHAVEDVDLAAGGGGVGAAGLEEVDEALGAGLADDVPGAARDGADATMEVEVAGEPVEEGVEVVAVGAQGVAEQVGAEGGGEEEHGDAGVVRDVLLGLVEEHEGAGLQLGGLVAVVVGAVRVRVQVGHVQGGQAEQDVHEVGGVEGALEVHVDEGLREVVGAHEDVHVGLEVVQQAHVLEGEELAVGGAGDLAVDVGAHDEVVDDGGDGRRAGYGGDAAGLDEGVVAAAAASAADVTTTTTTNTAGAGRAVAGDDDEASLGGDGGRGGRAGGGRRQRVEIGAVTLGGPAVDAGRARLVALNMPALTLSAPVARLSVRAAGLDVGGGRVGGAPGGVTTIGRTAGAKSRCRGVARLGRHGNMDLGVCLGMSIQWKRKRKRRGEKEDLKARGGPLGE
ncbi:hypothetical protein CTA1_6208 [Colletotrichum tanaceti]|uniref:Uncharacterized protein n=1 Tax=Colletotrichum tanaceti TaxID=1306861 RepID=A0A4U6XKA4_9PEZI|nr:hypothetical protein CTA1_6208 [Colletotrichum tanaceti]